MPVVDLGFSVNGREMPRDHGYALYGALCRAIPGLHGARWLGVHPVSGATRAGAILLLRRGAQLRLRLPAERIPEVLPLTGKELTVDGCRVRLGTPSVHALLPAPSLDARIVAIKLTDPPKRLNTALGRQSLDVAGIRERYLAALRNQLSKLEIAGTVTLQGRHSITVGGKRIIGYSVRVSELSPAAAIRLQEAGLGGKRAMGCGIFRPTRGS